MRTADFDYHLPEELIAQTPQPRGESRLLVLERNSGRIEHRHFADFPSFLQPGDTLVLNDTRVIARRLAALRENGLLAEALVLRPVNDLDCEALVRPGRSIRPGARLRLIIAPGEYMEAQVVSTTEEGGRRLRFASVQERDRLFRSGSAPLPPYIKQRLEDEERYQTVFAEVPGSAAAPTAGLHFTPEMLAGMKYSGIRLARVTLHVGLDTFRPVKTEEIEEHLMHGEHYRVCERDAEIINSSPGRIVAVGTTSVRVLESAGAESGHIVAGEGETRLFIYPGYRFNVVKGLLTNFHLPKSTLLMLVSAFAGRENALNAYQEAVRERYRFFSFGDAMLVI